MVAISTVMVAISTFGREQKEKVNANKMDWEGGGESFTFIRYQTYFFY